MEFPQTISILQNAKRILLTTHERTDGDDLSVTLALREHLETQGKSCVIAVKGGVPGQLLFLPGTETVQEEVPEGVFDLLVVSGCSTIDRIGNEKIYQLPTAVLNLDHHPDNTLYGTVNLVDSEKSSVAELVYDLFTFAGWEITPSIATCLLTGIFTDTGSFMHSNTSGHTLSVASALMQKGARTSTVAKHTYKGKSLGALKAWGRALQNSFLDTDNHIIYSVITEEDLADFDNIKPSAFEGLVETLNKVPEAKFALFLKQDGAVIKGSLRSDPFKGINVAKIAQLFGGGGHQWASGFSIAGKLARDAEGTWRVL